MKRAAALVLAASCLFLSACDDDDDDDGFSPTAPAVAPEPLPGALNPPLPAPLRAPSHNRAPTLVVRTRVNGTTLHVDMCSSSDLDNDNLNYKYLWGDGTRQYEEHAGFCAQSHTYGAGIGRRRVIVCVDDGWPDHEVCDNFFVTG
jgi:hypothetical protein